MTVSFEDFMLKRPTVGSVDGKFGRSAIVLRRMRRFFGADGICHQYEKSGDQLVQFGDVVEHLVSAVPGLNRRDAIRRFRFSVQHGGFCFRDYGPHRRTVSLLIDLDNYSAAPPTLYSLRPVPRRAAEAPELMRATRSTWAGWFKAQGWSVPPEFLGKQAHDISRKRGRPEAQFWKGIHRKIDDWLEDNGCPTPGHPLH